MVLGTLRKRIQSGSRHAKRFPKNISRASAFAPVGVGNPSDLVAHNTAPTTTAHKKANKVELLLGGGLSTGGVSLGAVGARGLFEKREASSVVEADPVLALSSLCVVTSGFSGGP